MQIHTIQGTYDVAVVGGGIVGLAHAYQAAKKNLRVAVFERSERPEGASVRNFGLIWPIGQAGENYKLAVRSRESWLEVLTGAGLYHQPTGSLHLTYREDEAAVAREFAEKGSAAGFDCAWLNSSQVPAKSNAVREKNLIGALWSPTEVTVDPRQVLWELPKFLASEYKIDFHFGSSVTAVENRRLVAGSRWYQASQIIICPGSELGQLYSEQLCNAELKLCKLQMMRTPPQPDAWKLGPALAGGLTLRFYPSFQICSSLDALRKRIVDETPDFDLWGIHTMVSQGADGSLTFGDSHEYGSAFTPFLRSDVEELITGHIEGYLRAPDVRLAERWYGVYAKHSSQPYCDLNPDQNIHIITGTGGAGMTLSFGIAEQVLNKVL